MRLSSPITDSRRGTGAADSESLRWVSLIIIFSRTFSTLRMLGAIEVAAPYRRPISCSLVRFANCTSAVMGRKVGLGMTPSRMTTGELYLLLLIGSETRRASLEAVCVRSTQLTSPVISPMLRMISLAVAGLSRDDLKDSPWDSSIWPLGIRTIQSRTAEAPLR